MSISIDIGNARQKLKHTSHGFRLCLCQYQEDPLKTKRRHKKKQGSQDTTTNENEINGISCKFHSSLVPRLCSLDLSHSTTAERAWEQACIVPLRKSQIKGRTFRILRVGGGGGGGGGK